jgi:two-component system chemotaxis response regulator CheB
MSRSDYSSEGAPIGGGSRPRVLVVDDSAPSRAAIADVLEDGGCDVVGRAMDGSVALRLLEEANPDVITCDLEMPRMDGFTFLRILQKTRATPVIVITSDARPEAAIMALELGARDFVVKPSRPGEMRMLQSQLVTRVRALTAASNRATPAWGGPVDVSLPAGVRAVLLGASTGGPRALRDIVARLRRPPRLPVLIAQHMPARFTEAFADRLCKTSGFDVREARHGDVVTAGQIRVAPGGKHMGISGAGPEGLHLTLSEPVAADRWVPSVDVLLRTGATHLGAEVLGIVLTGMGKDGGEGAKALRDVNAPLWTESPLTAAIDGMPLAASQSHGSAQRLPLDELAAMLARLLDPDGNGQ